MSIAKSGGKRPLKIDDEESIPAKYKYTITEIDRYALRQELESGEKIQGAHLEERGNYLKIS